MKFVLFAILTVEVLVYLVEMYYVNAFRVQAKMNNKKSSLTEKKKRKKFAIAYTIGNLIWLIICAIATMLLVLLINP